ADVEVVSVGHRELHGQGTGGDLGPDVGAPGESSEGAPENGGMGAVGGGEEGVGEGPADAELPVVDVGVLALLAGGDEDRALAGLAGGSEQRLDLVGLGEAAGDGLAVD